MNRTTWRWAIAIGAMAAGPVFAHAGCSAGVSKSDSGAEDDDDTSTGGGGGAGGESDAGMDAPIDSGPVQCDEPGDCFAFDTACTAGSCVNGLCVSSPANEFGGCDDGLHCTDNDTCVMGVCTGGTQKFCPSQDECHLGVCDEDLDTCKNVAGNDGAQCDDMDPCTNVGSCNGGTCTKGNQIDCSAFNSQCTVGLCDPQTGCKASPSNEGGVCNDGQFCNVNETCQSGMCTGGNPNPCAPPGGCYIASCNEAMDSCTAVPGNDGAMCDDLSPCTVGTTCLNGACINGQPANDGMMCDDGTMCTTGEFCSNGICGGGIGPQVYFADDFSDNSNGWTLGPEWEIGPAMLSMGGVMGADPDTDHTATLDDGIAGVVIGGNASTNLHPYYYLESPPFNTQNAPGPVILGFYRVLNSDYTPYMDNVVEVWNGAGWITLWNSGPPPGISDPSWTFIQHDLTAHKNAGMRVRFGFNITSGGVYTIGSWNVDDVLVAAAACP